MKTYSAKPLEVERKWYLIDAEGEILGRLAVRIANIYYHHTGYPGGLKSASFKELMEKDGTLALEKAVKGMLQHNTLGAQQLTKLKIYAGSEHPHAAQKPIVLEKEAK